MAMEKARWAESALAQCEERGEAANARALLETSLAKYVEAFVTAKLTRDDRAIHLVLSTVARPFFVAIFIGFWRFWFSGRAF